MDEFTRKLAAVMSSTDAVPRVIQHQGMTFLVTPQGEVWRALDTGGPDSPERSMPVADSTAWGRVFIGGGPEPTLKTYRFAATELRSIDAESLWRQLGMAKAGDERSA
jgi:hypothetical protein